MEKMKVAEIMTRKVIAVRPETKISEVAALLAKYDLHGVPVTDKANKIVGIITETDFFTKDEVNMHLPSYLHFLKRFRLSRDLSSKEQATIKKLIAAQARDIMKKEVRTVSPETAVSELLKKFQKEKLNLFPVAERGGKLAGIVAKADIIKLITGKKHL